MMKKCFALVLVVVMALGLMACGSDENKKLTVAMSPDFAPMEFVDTSKSGQDQYVGFDVTLAKFIAKEMGKELEIQPMSFDACQAAVQSGSVDMAISGFGYKEDRAENFNLSDFYYTDGEQSVQTIIVKSEKGGTFSKPEDFAGLKVGAQVASLQLGYCETQLPDSVEIVQFTDLGTAVEALRNDAIDALAVADGNGESIIAKVGGLAKSGFNFEIDPTEGNVILMKKGNDELTAEVNKILAKALSEELYLGWYNEAKELDGVNAAYDENGNLISTESKE
ncbi:MAG: transporter substrate-binding domain-containing protein [Lachnospiraceae bacterium]|nr:transporter substrate-binding domain-containing protein [Lachnospiraceae bacterium]